jgi:DNA uptake protein ComE-like DNA-binding protein
MKKSFALILTTISLSFAVNVFAADIKMPAAKPADAAKAAVAEKKSEAKSAAKQELIDINTASEDQLKAIPGLDTSAQKIIAGRPYTKKDQLVTKNIVPKPVYEKIKDKIIAKRVKK